MTNISSHIQNSASAPAWQAPVQTPTSLLGQLKGLFVTPDSGATHVQAAKDSFEQYFLQETSALAGMMGPKGIENFAGDVQAKFESIVQRTFDALPRKEDGSVGGKDFATAMKTAGSQAAQALDRLKVDAARNELLANLRPADTSPQIIPHKGGFVVIRPAPQLENLVLRGGGAKGIGYSAALDQMEKSGMMAGLKNLAGSSAGALTATCLACGLSASEFENGPADALFRPGVLDALKGGADLTRLYPDLQMEGGLAPAVASLKVVDQTSANSVSTYLNSAWNDAAFQAKLQQLDPVVQVRLDELRQPQNFDDNRQGKMVTFGDLKALHELAPEKFKNLTLTGWNKTDQKEVYFDAKTAPDMPVAYAARMSMAFPIAFKAVSIDMDGGKKVFADGGIGSNMPSEVFLKPTDATGARVQLDADAKGQMQARTLLLTFDENGKGYQIMHGGKPEAKPQGVLDKVKAFFVNLITSHPDQAGANLKDQKKVWNAGPNALPVFHGEISTLTSNISDQTQHQAHMLSAWKALEQIDARTQQAYSTRCDSLEEVAALLNPDEKLALQSLSNPDAQQARLLALINGLGNSAPPPLTMLQV
ncbi:patatin-like phospholipase family protein [Achromobacter sp. NFACC18-2]|uniref:patatin-like phospholipase family protein n=1 Tax=Achromobacter sp. NFACC18-2 TaxID=1564112 RepID=UPI0008D2C94E|nr:patatin-like phospholipase family protein [Achromobacter sp. NFACC18-2]SEJ51528.1 Patatin-like phospholipase [Achromobacter sp. NFACC18-2]